MNDLLPDEKQEFSRFLTPYLIASFGSFTRMDYGTGHETAFGIFMLCLSRIRFFQPEPDEDRALVFSVFLRYVRLCWRLQDIYRLEPAGSHGVWGLDDYSFLGYIFGSAQLRGPSLSCAFCAPFSHFGEHRPERYSRIGRPATLSSPKQPLFHVDLADP